MWTSNIQGWNQHSGFEWSNKLEAIEILTPARDASGKFLGIDWETVFYDPEVLVQPIRNLWHRNYQQSWSNAARLTWTECTRPLYPMCERSSFVCHVRWECLPCPYRCDRSRHSQRRPLRVSLRSFERQTRRAGAR